MVFMLIYAIIQPNLKEPKNFHVEINGRYH